MVTNQPQRAITIGGRTIGLAQILVGLILLLIVAFLIYGTVNQPPQENAFGIQTQPFPLLALLAFAAGFLSFVSPCTLPILPAYFAFAFQSGRSQIATNTLSFMLGLATVFSLMGAISSFVGSFLIQNQRLILILGGAMVVVFGLMSLLGGGFTGMQAQQQGQRETSVTGSFLFGMTFAVGWTSCVGPILGAVATMAATTGSVAQGTMLLFIYTLGLGLPLIIVSTLFGRAPRDSFVWRMLRGKGWFPEVHKIVVGAIWAYGIWLIVVPIIRYAFPEVGIDQNTVFSFSIQVTLLLGLFLLALGAYIGYFLIRSDWRALRGRARVGHGIAAVLSISIIAAGIALISQPPGAALTIDQGILELGLLALFLAGAALWVFTQPERRTTIHLHSTQIVSGVLFLMLGVLFLNSQLSIFNSLAVSERINFLLADLEDTIVVFFSR